jgi:hypothetical protein
MRIADALADRAGADIAIIDMTAFFAGFGKSAAAGEGDHAPLKRG